MFGLQQLFHGHGHRPRPVEEKDVDEAEQPPTKKIKTIHDSNNNNNEDKAVTPAQQEVFSIPSLLGNIVDFLDDNDELQLAACNVPLFVFFHVRASERLVTIYSEADPNQKSLFFRRVMNLAKSLLSSQDQVRFLNTEEQPNYWQLLWMWLRGKRPPRWIKPRRYMLQCAYLVPVDLQEGFDFGPSCSYGDRLYILAAAGVVVTMDSEPKTVDLELTRPAERNPIMRGYSHIFDTLWYCCANNNYNYSNDGKGFLVMMHLPNFRTNEIRVLDLSQTNQDIGREENQTGIDHRRITPSDAFLDEEGRITAEMVVSERDGLIIFVCLLDGGGTIAIESYNMTGQLVASTRETVYGAGGIRAHTNSVVTQDKLVIAYHTENGNDGVTDYGLGIYVFARHDLSFCTYTPFFCNHDFNVKRISENWLYYRQSGTDNTFALKITGGNVVGQQPTPINLGNSPCDVLLAGDHIYAHKAEEEGNIEFDQFDLQTGNKIRTLKTNIPWKFDDDGTAFLPLAGPPVEGTIRRLSRHIANAHVVGNKAVFIISSQGSAKNTIVAFVVPPTSSF